MRRARLKPQRRRKGDWAHGKESGLHLKLTPLVRTGSARTRECTCVHVFLNAWAIERKCRADHAFGTVPQMHVLHMFLAPP